MIWIGLAVIVFIAWARGQTTTGALSNEPSSDLPAPQPIEPEQAPNADVANVKPSDVNPSTGVIDLAQAIAHAEGYGVQGAIPTRANNPGDLVMPHWGGETLGAERISVFPTPEDGWAALYHQLQLIEDGRSHVYDLSMTFLDMANKWTSTQKPEWAANVVAALQDAGYDVSVDSTIGEVL